MQGVQVMVTISLQYNNLSQIHSSFENGLTGRTYMVEVLTQVWLKSVKN